MLARSLHQVDKTTDHKKQVGCLNNPVTEIFESVPFLATRALKQAKSIGHEA